MANVVVLVFPAVTPAGAAGGEWTLLYESFDNVTAPALPSGWTATLAAGQSTDRAWRTGTPPVTTYPNAASAAAPSHVTDNRLTSPAFVALAGTTLTFQHHVWLQPGYDGGVLEIKVGSGPWVDFLAAGGGFTQDGYDRTVSSSRNSPIGGRSAWTGQRTSAPSTPLTYYTSARLPAAAAGQSTQLRWRLATDNASGGGGFWHVDSVHITAPVVTVTVNQAATQADPATSSPVNFTAVFSTPVTGFTGSDVTIGGTAPGTKTAVVTGGPSTYNIAVSGMTGSGTVTASLDRAVVPELNDRSTSTDNVVSVNLVTPRTVTLNQASGQLDPTNASPVRFGAVFSNSVSGFTGTDVVVGGTAPGTKSVVVSGGPAVYTIAVSGMTGPGTVVPSIPANVVTEGNAASTSSDNSVTYDNVPPRVAINQASTQADPAITSPVTFTAAFTEPVTGFTAADVAIAGTASGTKTVVVTGGPSTYTVTVSGITGSGTVSASIPAGRAFDLVGNANTASTSTDNVVSYDTTRSVTINRAAAQADPTNVSPIRFTVVFGSAVTGFTNTDVLIAGSAPGTKSVVVSGGPSTYTVAVSGMTGPGTVVASIPANAVTPANLASTSDDNSVLFDNVAPRVVINQAATQPDPAITATVAFTATFTEPVIGFTGSDVAIAGTAPGTKTATVTGGPISYTVTVSGMTGPGTVVASIPAGVLTDNAGNPNVASTSTDNTVQVNIRTVTINQAADQPDPTNTSPIRFAVVFGQSVTGFTSSDVTIGGTAPGAKTAVVTGGPTAYTVAVSGMSGSGTVTASIPANVVSGGNLASTSTDNTVAYDVVPPTVTINQAATQSDPSATAPITFTAVFSEPVSGFTGSDIAFAGTAAGFKTAAVTGGPTTFTVTVSGMTGSGTVVASIPAGRVTDAAANLNVASTSTDNSVQLNLRTVTINRAATQADPTNRSPIYFTVVFSTATTGFTSSDVVIAGSTPGTEVATVTGGPTSYTVAISGMTGSGSVVAIIPANVVDGGNVEFTTTDNMVVYDVAPPTVTINQAASQIDPATTSPVTFTAVFSEPVTGFTGSDVAVGGTATGTKTVTVTGGPTTFTLTVAGMTRSGTVVPSIAAGRLTDAVGNLNTASTSTDNSVQVNLRTVTINRATTQADPTNRSPIEFTVVFSNAVTGFTSADVTLGGTALGQTAVLTGGPTTYNVAISGMTGSGTVVPSIRANVVDGGNVASTSSDNLVIYDVVPPTVVINQAPAQADPTTVAPITFLAQFDSVVTGFSAADVSITGTAPGTLTAVVQGSGGSYFVDVYGMTGPGTVVVSVPAGAAVDTAGNPSTAATSTDNSVQFHVVAPPPPPVPSVVVLDIAGDGVDGSGVATTSVLTGSDRTVRWTVPGTDDAFVAFNATGLRDLGYDVRSSEGVPQYGLVLAQGGLIVTGPSGVPATVDSGLAFLRALDMNADGNLDALDATLQQLILFTDADGDGTIGETELLTVDFVRSIGLTVGPPVTDSAGNDREEGYWTTSDATIRLVVDIAFASAPAAT